MTSPHACVQTALTGTERLCKYCSDPFTPRNDQQEFCVGKNCRQKWHRESKARMHGQVHGIYQRPSGGWSVVLHFNVLPETLKRGQIVTDMETQSGD